MGGGCIRFKVYYCTELMVFVLLTFSVLQFSKSCFLFMQQALLHFNDHIHGYSLYLLKRMSYSFAPVYTEVPYRLMAKCDASGDLDE